jgi:hypothetical protein
MIEIDDASLTLKNVEVRTPTKKASVIQIEEDSLVNGTKKVELIRPKLDEPT